MSQYSERGESKRSKNKFAKVMSFSEYLSQKEESQKDSNPILKNLDRKRLSNFGGFGNKLKPNLHLIDNYDINYSARNAPSQTNEKGRLSLQS